MLKRIEKVRNKLKDLNLDSLFITNQVNVTYLTGFAGLSQDERGAYLFITQNAGFLLTFPTYFGLYKKGGEGFTTLSLSADKRLPNLLDEIVKKENIGSIGFEKENLTVAELTALKRKLPVKFQETEKIVENLRIVKDGQELDKIRKAVAITDRGFDFIKSKIKKGITERQLALELEFFLKKESDGVSFPPIVAFNQGSAIPHYLPSKDQRLKTNSLILLDFGAKVEGYCSDMTRVVFYKKPKDIQIKIYQTVVAAQELALKKLKAGILGSGVDGIARNFIKSCGYGEYPHGLGHGVGLAIHESPRMKQAHHETLEENMVVTVEPGIYIEGYCGVRIEDLVVLKKNGVEILSKSSKDLTII